MRCLTDTPCCVASTEDTGYFLAEYSAWLMGCGATCIRIEKNVERIAREYGKHVEISIMPRHIQMTVHDRTDDSRSCLTVNTSVKAMPVSFALNTQLSELSWRISDGHIPLAEAEKMFCDIVSRSCSRRRQVPWLVALANASFCALFGGDTMAMCVVGAATLAGYWLKELMLAHHIDLRVVFVVCAFVSAVLGCTDMLFGLGSTPYVAIGTSVLYLVPGIPLLNSFSDMLYRHYICAFGRFADAVVLTCCLSTGLCFGMMAMNVGMFSGF